MIAMQFSQETAIGVMVLLLLVALVRFLISTTNKKKEMPQIEIARLVEDVGFTTGGTIAVFLLILHNCLMFYLYVGATKSAVQEASIGTIWIAGNVLFGIGAIIGRHRTHRVLRDQNPDRS